MFDLEKIQKSGHAKGIRDLKFCQESDLELGPAMAKKILEIHNALISLLGHRVYGIKDIFNAKGEDKALFEQVLSLNIAVQYLSIYATLHDLDVPKYLLDYNYDQRKDLLLPESFRNAVFLVRMIERGNHRQSSLDTFSSTNKALINLVMGSVHGHFSRNIDILFDRDFAKKDKVHQSLKQEIEIMFQNSAIIMLEEVGNSMPLPKEESPAP